MVNGPHTFSCRGRDGMGLGSGNRYVFSLPSALASCNLFCIKKPLLLREKVDPWTLFCEIYPVLEELRIFII